MPVPDQVRDDGSGIQFRFLDSGFRLSKIPIHRGMTTRRKWRGIEPEEIKAVVSVEEEEQQANSLEDSEN